jgi:hypothetical protein
MHYIYASLRTPDGTLLESRPRHDFASHKEADGSVVFLDLGYTYCRTSCLDCPIFLVTSEDPHSTIREYLEWGTYGKNGDQPLEYIKLKDITDDHLYTLVSSYLDRDHIWYDHFKNELDYRAGTHEDLQK